MKTPQPRLMAEGLDYNLNYDIKYHLGRGTREEAEE